MTLFRRVEPLPDESLSGLVARAAAINVYPRSLDVLVQAGISGLAPGYIAMRDGDFVDDLARVLGTEADRLKSMLHRPAGAGLDFFGATIRSVYIERKLRRVSPRALKMSPHVRAIWHLRPLAFDPSTKERLLSHCPVCDRALGFVITKGVAFCDHCTVDGDDAGAPLVDLRDFPQALVEVEDLEALDFVTALVDPDPVVRSSFTPVLHDDLTGMDRSELFEMVTGIATAIMANEDTRTQPSDNRTNRGMTRFLDAGPLARAGRSLMKWPGSFADLLVEARAGKDSRHAQWGRLKELGALAVLPRDDFMPAHVKALLAAQVDRFFVMTPVARDAVRKGGTRDPELYIGARELKRATGVDNRLVTALSQCEGIVTYRTAPPPAPLVFVRHQVMPIMRRYKDLVAEGSAGFNLGLPVESLRDMVAAGYLERATGIETTLVAGDVCYSAAQLDDYFGFYIEHAGILPREEGFITFSDAMLMFPAGRRPWFALWEQILWGRIDSCMHREKTKALTDIVCVRAAEIDREALVARMAELPMPVLDNVTIGNARLSLGIQSYPVFTACVDAGIFELNADKTVPYGQVLDFARQFILTNEIGVRSGIGRQKLRGWLEDNGVMPARDLGVKGGLLFDRERVVQLLG